jgi:hypothetical protein
MNGRSPGFASFVTHLPANDLTVIVLSNIYSSATTDIGNDIAAIVLGKPYAPFSMSSGAIESKSSALDGAEFSFGSDFYRKNATLRFQLQDKELFLKWPNGDLSPMIPVGKDKFIDRSYWVKVAVERDSTSRPIALTYDRFRAARN